MAITFTQAQVNAAVNYLLTGGPNGGQITLDQFKYMTGISTAFGQPNNFVLQLQLAINQGHAGLSNCTLLARDQWGKVVDVFYGYSFPGNVVSGRALSFINSLGVSISG